MGIYFEDDIYNNEEIMAIYGLNKAMEKDIEIEISEEKNFFPGEARWRWDEF